MILGEDGVVWSRGFEEKKIEAKCGVHWLLSFNLKSKGLIKQITMVMHWLRLITEHGYVASTVDGCAAGAKCQASTWASQIVVMLNSA